LRVSTASARKNAAGTRTVDRQSIASLAVPMSVKAAQQRRKNSWVITSRDVRPKMA
jgi:hypothetical protein